MMGKIACSFYRLLFSATLAGVFEPPLAFHVYERDEFTGRCTVAILGERGVDLREFGCLAAAKKYIAARIAEHLQSAETASEKEGVHNERVEWDDTI